MLYEMSTDPVENDTRCSGIKFILEKFFPNKKIRVLDIGTDIGYIAHCLADNGLTVHGVDSNSEISKCISAGLHSKKENLNRIRKNCIVQYQKQHKKYTYQIKVANLVKKYNNLKNVTFEHNFVDFR